MKRFPKYCILTAELIPEFPLECYKYSLTVGSLLVCVNGGKGWVRGGWVSLFLLIDLLFDAFF